MARAITRNAQPEECKHFGMDLDFLLRQSPNWREVLKGIPFLEGNSVEHTEEAADETS